MRNCRDVGSKSLTSYFNFITFSLFFLSSNSTVKTRENKFKNGMSINISLIFLLMLSGKCEN